MSQSKGSSRFRGPGALWKSPWRGSRPFSEAFCIRNFGAEIGNNYYQDTDALAFDGMFPDEGFFVGVVVGFETPLPIGASRPIARSSATANSGWALRCDAVDAESVVFVFTVFDGVGVAATVTSATVSLAGVGGLELIGTLFVSVLTGFVGPAPVPPFGTAFISVMGTNGFSDPREQPLSSPYASVSPLLQVGRDSVGGWSSPNCIQGLIGGYAEWVGSFEGLNQMMAEWDLANREASAIQEFPMSPIATVTTNGWRSPIVEGISPNPLLPFVGAEPLVYGSLFGSSLIVGSHSPVYFWPDNVTFPFG